MRSSYCFRMENVRVNYGRFRLRDRGAVTGPRVAEIVARADETTMKGALNEIVDVGDA